MTFLEIVAATALLGVVAAAVFGVFSFVVGSQSRDQTRLGAAEVANRLMLAYLDDPTHMPDSHKTVAYGPLQYRWTYVEQPLTLTEVNQDQRDTTRQSTLNPDRFVQVTIQSWLSENSGGSRVPDGSTPAARLTRMVDPVAPRNPDSFMNMIQDPANFQKMMESMMGFQGGVTVNGGLPGSPPGQAGKQGQRPNSNQFQRPGPGQFGARQAFQRGRGGGAFQSAFGPRGFTRGGGGGGGGGGQGGQGGPIFLGGGR